MDTEEDEAWNTEGPMRMSRRVRSLNVMEDQYQRSAGWWRMAVDVENTRFRDQKDPDPYIVLLLQGSITFCDCSRTPLIMGVCVTFHRCKGPDHSHHRT